MSVRELLATLAGIQETVLIYPSTGGRPRARRMTTEMSTTQHHLYDLFGLAAYAPQPKHAANGARLGNTATNPLYSPSPACLPLTHELKGKLPLASRGESVEAHELMHSLGSVLPSAPNSTAAGHCEDESDRMCYSDGSALFLQDICDPDLEALFDCEGDDYFHPSPPAGSCLTSHWNTARSAFLSDDPGDPTISVSDTQVLEGDEGTSTAMFTVTLGSASSKGVSVRYTTSSGTAVAGSDFARRERHPRLPARPEEPDGGRPGGGRHRGRGG